MTKVNKKLLINGIVQGVGFRPTVYSYAQKHRLTGWVLNASHGVEIELHGETSSIQAFIEELRSHPPKLAQIDNFLEFDSPFQQYEDFRIIESTNDPKEFLPVSPDLNVCPDCLAELFDPDDRRYRYPFINCTNCGPRFSIVRSIPYDRPNTSMSGFPLCPECDHEYHNPGNRRFHAQPVTPVPSVGHILASGRSKCPASGDEALKESRQWLTDVRILAVKGLGGFHLVCDTNNPETVNQLRLRKKRSGKPFALMAYDLETIQKYATISEAERAMLTSPQAPIVLLQLNEKGRELAEIVAPDQNTLGFMSVHADPPFIARKRTCIS